MSMALAAEWLGNLRTALPMKVKIADGCTSAGEGAVVLLNVLS